MIPRPAISPSRPWSFPQPVIHNLDNGMRVWLYDLPGQHIISCALVLELPIISEPIDGLGTITVRALDEGTLTHPGQQFAETLEGLGGEFHGAVGQSTTQCFLNVPASTFTEAFPLFAEAVQEPCFSETSVNIAVSNRLAEIEQQQSVGSVVAAQSLRAALLSDEMRISRPFGGTASSVRLVTPEAVRDFHSHAYHPAEAILIIAGALDGLNPHHVAMDAFARWPNFRKPTPTQDPIPGNRMSQRIHRIDAVQTDVHMGWYGIDRSDPRWTALSVALTMMGGSFSSRLNQRIREEKGYTYGISMYPRPFRKGGLIEITASTRTAMADQMIDEILDTVSLKRPFTQDETDSAINYLVGSTPLILDTADAIMSQATTIAAARLRMDYVNRLIHELSLVTPATATEAYRELIDADSSTIIRVGA